MDTETQEGSVPKVEKEKKKAAAPTPPTQVELIAIRNTFLPDGSFVPTDGHIKVEPSYAERVLSETNSPFRGA